MVVRLTGSEAADTAVIKRVNTATFILTVPCIQTDREAINDWQDFR